MPELAKLEGTPIGLVASVRDELDPHLQHLDDPDDRERVARKVVARVLRELGTVTYQGDDGWGNEPESLDSDRLDELAEEIEDSLR